MAHIELGQDAVEALCTNRAQEEFYDSSFSAGGSFGVRVSKSGRKSYFVIYPVGKKRRRMTLGLHPLLLYEAARAQALSVLSLAAEGRDPAKEQKRYRTAQSFSELAGVFVERHARERLSAATVREYERILKTELLPCWADRRAVDVTSGDVAALLEEISKARNSPVMANRVRALISNIFKFAVARHVVEKNPVTRTVRPSTESPREHALRIEEIAALWEVLAHEDVLMQGIFKLLILTGQRPGEVMAVKWSDIDFEIWTLRASKAEGMPHRVWLSPQALSVLREVRNKHAGEEYVFPSSSGKHISHIRKAAKRLCERMGCEQPWNPQDLRRSVELHLRSLGIRPDVIEVIMNRKTALSRLRVSRDEYDYFPEVKSALLLWGRTVAEQVGPAPEPRHEGKVVKLFR